METVFNSVKRIMSQPRVSVIVPVYNTEKYLHRCLDSILVQTYKEFEVILVDDGSTDQSGFICDEYAAKDSRFVVIHKQNEGVSKARVTAFEHSKGDLITFIDSDDYVSPDYIEKLLGPILEDDADMVSCDCYWVEDGKINMHRGKLVGTYENDGIHDFVANHYFYDHQTNGYGMTCYLCTKIIKRNYVLNGLKEVEGMWFAEDQLSMFAMLLQCKRLVLIPDRLYYYVQHKGQAVKRYDKSIWDNIILLLNGYQKLLPDNSCQDSLRFRTWLHIIHTINDKMIPAGVNINTFVSHLSYVRNQPFMKTFFRPASIGINRKDDLKYWLLKYKLFFLLFVFIKIRKYRYRS